MTPRTYYCYLDSPLGQLLVCGDGESITGLTLPGHKRSHRPQRSWQQSESPFRRIRKQLNEYFAGRRRQFKIELHLAGTPFQRLVWQELLQIPYGTTISYRELARRLGKPTACRAVGHANGRNPVSILVPCHRVIGVDGTLTGYAGGTANKRWLLDFECSNTARRIRPGLALGGEGKAVRRLFMADSGDRPPVPCTVTGRV